MQNLIPTTMLVSALALSACTDEVTSGPKFQTGAGAKRGHEDITRYGVKRANAQLEAVVGISEFYPVPAKGAAGIDTSNQLIRGNFETDFPEKRFFDFYEAVNHFPLVRWLDWHKSPRLQHLHGLRNSEGGIFQDQFATCRQTTDAIVTAVRQALPLLRQDPSSGTGQHWLGHATHMVQDTFSKAHTIRDGRILVDHCTYEVKDSAICFHNDGDTRDDVWRQDGGTCEFDPTNRNWACLVPEAQAAAQATAGLLTVAGQLALNKDLDIDSTLRRWFHGDPQMYESGYLDCRPMGMTLLRDYFRYLSPAKLLPSEVEILNAKLEGETLPEVKQYLFEKYGRLVIEGLAGVALEDDLLQRYLPYLRDFGHVKLGDKLYIEDSIEIVKHRVLRWTGKDVDPVWLPIYTNILMNQRSIARLDDEIKKLAAGPQPAPPLDECGNLPTPIEVILCRTNADRLN